MDKLSRAIDISLPLHPKIPKWLGSEGIKVNWTKRMEIGDKVNISKLECDVHVGTHVNSQRHFIEDRSTVEALPLNVLIGPVVVIAIFDAKVFTAKHLSSIGIPYKTERLILEDLNLANVKPGKFEFICLPIRFVGTETASAHAFPR
jgi:arylformamidase